MSWKILITARTLNEVGHSALDLLRQAGCEIVNPPRFGPLPVDELLPVIDGADAVLASMDQFTEGVLNSPATARLKTISALGSWLRCHRRASGDAPGNRGGVLPGFLNETVADYAFALLLALARRVHESHLTMRGGQWQSAWGHDVHGKTLGILGCGRIGQAMARRATGFNMRLIVVRPRAESRSEKIGLKFVSLDQLLAESDFLSLHAALTPEQPRTCWRSAAPQNEARRLPHQHRARARWWTRRLSCARCTEGWIAGAALDAVSDGAVAGRSPAAARPNLLLTPHQASFAREDRRGASV